MSMNYIGSNSCTNIIIIIVCKLNLEVLSLCFVVLTVEGIRGSFVGDSQSVLHLWMLSLLS